MIPRGVRNCNPGNLRPSKQPWLGQTGTDGGHYCRFDTMAHGIRALAMQLLIYQDKHQVRTIRACIMRWAPASDNNDTAAYITAVCAACGVGPDDDYNMRSISRLTLLVDAIIEHENGRDSAGGPWVRDNDVDRGVADAIMSYH